MSDRNARRYRPFCCRACGLSLGFTDGRSLVNGAQLYVQRVEPTCIQCRHRTLWTPSAQAAQEPDEEPPAPRGPDLYTPAR